MSNETEALRLASGLVTGTPIRSVRIPLIGRQRIGQSCVFDRPSSSSSSPQLGSLDVGPQGHYFEFS